LQLPENSGILIQARTGSTRLPGKMKSIFYKDLTLAELVFKKLSALNFDLPVVLATSNHANDDCLIEWARNYGLKVFRGEEEDVLCRFIEAAKTYNINNVIRVCADNPFISIPHIIQLLELQSELDCDYLSFKMKNGVPVIKSHIGLFAEVVKLSALLKVKEVTTTKLYREHVTNFIYTNPNKFNVQLVELPNYLADRNDIRLTIDTKEDFDLAAYLFEKLCKNNNLQISTNEIVNYLHEQPGLLINMQKEIEKNAK